MSSNPPSIVPKDPRGASDTGFGPWVKIRLVVANWGLMSVGTDVARLS